MDGISINRDVRSVGAPPTGDVALPAANVEAYDAPLLDRAGDTVRERGWIPAIGAGLGIAGGSMLASRLGRGVLGHGMLGIVGGALGIGAALTAAVAVDELTERPAPGPTAPPPDVAVRAEEDLRVMTYNLHGAQGPRGERFASEAELERLAASVRRERPDVVLLQEIDLFATRSNWTDTLAELAERLGATGAVFTPRGTTIAGRQEGTGVLTFNGVEIEDARGLVTPDPYGGDVARRTGSAVASGLRGLRQELLGQDVRDTGVPDYMPRVTTDAMLETPAGNHVRVLSGHYTGPRTETDNQQIQVAPVVGLVDDWAGPTIWGADFNVRSGGANGGRERRMLREVGLADAFLGAGVRPGSRERGTDIDRLYHSSQFEVGSVDVARFPAGEPEASDHYPVTAELRLRRPEGAAE